MFGLQKLTSAFDKKGKHNADEVILSDRLVAGIDEAGWLKFLKPAEKQDFIRIFTQIIPSGETSLSHAMTAAANAASYVLKKQALPHTERPDIFTVARTIVRDALKSTENMPENIVLLRAMGVRKMMGAQAASGRAFDVIG